MSHVYIKLKEIGTTAGSQLVLMLFLAKILSGCTEFEFATLDRESFVSEIADQHLGIVRLEHLVFDLSSANASSKTEPSFNVHKAAVFSTTLVMSLAKQRHIGTDLVFSRLLESAPTKLRKVAEEKVAVVKDSMPNFKEWGERMLWRGANQVSIRGG